MTTLPRASRRAVLAGLLAAPAAAQQARRLARCGGARHRPAAAGLPVFPAGPPAAILVGASPRAARGLAGRAPQPAELAFMESRAAALPAVGRLNQARQHRE